jgi:chitin disaccharide deacetylase
MKRLIVTGDDFGLSAAVNEAIERAHRDGILNTASLMVAEQAVDDAVRRARALPRLRVGLHVVVVRGRPVLTPSEIPDLVGPNGRFATELGRAGVNFFFRPRVRRQLEAEIRVQFQKFAATGLPLDHVNAHNHMHLHPTVLGMLVRIGRDFGSPPIRLPREPFVASWRAMRSDFGGRLWNGIFLAPWLALMRARLRLSGVASNDALFGLNDTGRMTEDRVVRFFDCLSDGVTEMYFHPAVDDWRPEDPEAANGQFAAEFAALTSPKVAQLMRERGIVSFTFAELAALRRNRA